jgi:hypothetical protein
VSLPPIRLGHDVHDVTAAPSALLLSLVAERGLVDLRTDHWATASSTLPELGPPLVRVESDRHESGLYDLDGTLVSVGLGSGWAYATVAASGRAAAADAIERLRELLPPPDPSAKHEVNVTFWTYTPHGPQPSWRSIAVPEWDEIRGNYAEATQAGLEEVMRGFTPAHGGQLILWHGSVGTGKTFALRALAWEWRDWCDLHYIVDPDSFFGQHADYLMSVLLQPAERQIVSAGGWTSYAPMHFQMVEAAPAEEEPEPAWRLLILEDTGELISADAKAVVGQGLSRFLNVVDGLIGQGLRVLVLVTTNEEIRRLHPAIARPGRCAANIEFQPLGADEAAAWLAERGVEERPRQPMPLAALYARAAGLDPGEFRAVAGFGG